MALHGLTVQWLSPSRASLATMLILLKSIVRNLILPPSGPLLIAILGLLLAVRRRTLGMTLVVVGVVCLWLLSTPVVGDLLSHMVERYPPLDPSRPVTAQAIVVLGGGGARYAPEFGGWALERASMDRVVYGAFLARRASLPILVSGSPEEAEAMKATLSRDLGMPARWIEGRSGDTYQNAEFSTPILKAAGVHRIVLITTGAHEWRAAHEFMAAGFDVVPAPVNTNVDRTHNVAGFLPDPDGLNRSYSALYEMLGEPVRQVMAALHIRRQPAIG
jgi:uncharacterized SAM-binding protein YcdF (DUF218 family)